MGSSRRKQKIARKQAGSAKTPSWLFDKDVPIGRKREVEDALARHLVDNGITVGSKRYKQLVLRDIIPSLKSVHSRRWRAVEPGMINAATQPVVKALAAHLQDHKKGRKVVSQMVADLKAKDDEPRSSQGSASHRQVSCKAGRGQDKVLSAEEGEEEEAQADDSDGERTDQKPAYVEGDPRELQQADGGDEAAKTDGQEATQLIEQLIDGIRAQKAAEGSAEHESPPLIGGQETQLRITAADVRRWVEIGERCKRIQHYYQEMDKEEDAVFVLLKDCPLAYSWQKVKELHAGSQESCKSQGDEPADKAGDCPPSRGRP